MQQIIENLTFEKVIYIMGFWGIAHAVALVIVKATPTPRDDKALDKVNGIVRGIAAIFGLDLRRGINTRPTVEMTTWRTCETCSKDGECLPSSKKENAKFLNCTGWKSIIVALFAIVSLSSCATMQGIAKDPRKQFKITNAAFRESVQVLTVLKKNSKLSEKEVATADESIKLGLDILRKWSRAIEAGKSYPGLAEITPIITKLNEMAKRGNNDVN